MKKCLRWIVSTVLFVCLVLSNANADPVSSVSGSDVNIDATKGVSICAGTGDVRIATDCTGGGTQTTWRFDNATGTFIGAMAPSYIGGDLVVRANNDSQRLLTFTSASDTDLRLHFGDGGTTAAQILKVRGNTTDGDDDATILIGPGGDASVAGGAVLGLYGNENASVGAAILQAGNNASAQLILGTTGTNGLIRLETGASIPNLTLRGTVATALSAKFGDSGTTDLPVFTIASSNSDADDDSVLKLAGGGDASTTRGAYITLDGNETSTTGDLVLSAGGTATSDIWMFTPTGGTITYQSDTQHMRTAAGTIGVSFGVSGTASNIRGGATSLQFNNYANTFANLTIVDDGDTTINRGSLIFGAALSTIRAGATSIQFNNAANSVANLTIADAGPITIRNTLVSSDTGTLGWSVVNAANQACTTTCTSACVFGMNTGALGNFVGCADATADTCVCAGAS